LHQAAALRGHSPLLEVSTKSEERLGQRLSAFSLKINTSRYGEISLESAYQGSKVFERGGPYTDLYSVDAREAKKDPRVRDSGRIIAFRFDGLDFPSEPKTAFYDWLYSTAIYPHREFLRCLDRYAGFTDIEFNPEKSLNCQARACAIFTSMMKRGILDRAMESPERFVAALRPEGSTEPALGEDRGIERAAHADLFDRNDAIRQENSMANSPSKDEKQTDATDRETIRAALNYLRWFAAENHAGKAIGPPFSAETSLDWFCQTLTRPILNSLKGRYAALAGIDNEAAVFPTEQALVEKVLIPLHQAKVAFVLGHELGCIALSGMVAEMLATLRFQMSRHGSGPNAMTKSRQDRLFGRSFEEIEHSRRLGILELLELIDPATGNQFKEMSGIRNKYLHRFSQPHEEMEKDARRSYELAVTLAVKVLGLGVAEGRAKVAPEVLAYIKARQASSTDQVNTSL
jgi:hypothetical protein